MGETLWQGEGVVISWYTGPKRPPDVSRRRFVITSQVDEPADAFSIAVDLSWPQWLALWRFMASRAEVPGNPGDEGPSVFMVDHARSDRANHIYCQECFDLIPSFLVLSRLEVTSHKPDYEWSTPVECEGCHRMVPVKEAG